MTANNADVVGATMPTSDDVEPPTPGLTADERDFVHRVAEHYRDTDRMAWKHGYLIGWLLICDPVEQSASQLVQTLGVTRDAVDFIARLLVPPGILERRDPDTGDDYRLSLRYDAWPKIVQHALLSLPEFHAVMAHGVQVLTDAPAERRRRVENMERFYRYLGTEIPAVFDRYQEAQEQ